MACFVICCHSYLWLPPLFMLDSHTFDCNFDLTPAVFFTPPNQDSNLQLKAVTYKSCSLTHPLTCSIQGGWLVLVHSCACVQLCTCMGVVLCAQWLLCFALSFASVQLYGLFIINERFGTMLCIRIQWKRTFVVI